MLDELLLPLYSVHSTKNGHGTMHVILGIRDSGTNQILHLPVVPRETEFHPVQALGRLRNHVEENDHLRRKYCLAFTADCHFLAGFCLAPLA